MKRRDFLKNTVVTGTAGVLFDACAPPGSDQIIPILIPEEEFIPGVEEFHPTNCVECPGGCGLLARKMDGRLVKVEGNPAHPISRGASCARGQALPQAMYHPDRVRGPLIREGARGAGQWRNVSWDDAIERLVSELAAVQEDPNNTLAFLTGALRGHRLDMVRRFTSTLEATRHLVHEPFGDGAVLRAHALTTGVEEFFAYDLENANYLVTVGASVLDASRSPVRFGRGVGHLRQGRPGRRGKLVAVQPRLSTTAAAADEWLPARPGSEASLVLALAHVILRDELYDTGFIENRTSGFEEFRARVLADFEPELVAGMAGVSVETLERVATEMAMYGPTIVIAGDAAVTGPRGLGTAVAVDHLNALLGGFGKKGGIFFNQDPPFSEWPSLETVVPAPEALFANLTKESDASSGIRALLISDTNPVHTLPLSAGIHSFLSEIPFVACFTSFVDDTAQMADLILPESTPFERFDDDVPSPSVGIPVATLSAPMFSRPLYDTMSMPDVLLRVAAGLGGTVAEAFPWASYEEALRAAWSGLHAASRGSVAESTERRFWTRALAAGGWWDEDVALNADCLTSDGLYRFELSALESIGLDMTAAGDTSRFTLHVYPSTAFGDGRSAHLPFLQELADPMTSVRWGSVVELNASTASELNISDGDLVEITSDTGSLRVRAQVTQGLRPDVVALSAGQGHGEYGRYARGRGVNPFSLLQATTGSDLFEAPLQATTVRVIKIEETG